MFETMVAFTLAEHLGGLTFDPPQGAAGYQRLLAGGRRPAPTRDGHVAMLPYSGEHWREFFRRTGRDDLAAKYNFDDRHERNARIREIYDDMASVTGRMTSAECLALCEVARHRRHPHPHDRRVARAPAPEGRGAVPAQRASERRAGRRGTVADEIRTHAGNAALARAPARRAHR